jgi:hypothetical protein
MRGGIAPLPQNALKAWWSVKKEQGQLFLLPLSTYYRCVCWVQIIPRSLLEWTYNFSTHGDSKNGFKIFIFGVSSQDMFCVLYITTNGCFSTQFLRTPFSKLIIHVVKQMIYHSALETEENSGAPMETKSNFVISYGGGATCVGTGNKIQCQVILLCVLRQILPGPYGGSGRHITGTVG